MVMMMTVVMVMVMTTILVMLIVTILVRKREGEMMRVPKDGGSGEKRHHIQETPPPRLELSLVEIGRLNLDQGVGKVKNCVFRSN